MNEGINPESADLFKAPRFSQVLITEISYLNYKLSQIRNLPADPQLTEEARKDLMDQKKQYLNQIHADLFCLTTLRRDNDLEEEIGIEMYRYPSEIIHPFSRNSVRYIFTIDRHEKPGTYAASIRLRDLRGPDVDDSIQAEEFLGQKVEVIDDNPATYLLRTAEELSHIESTISRINEGTHTETFSVNYLSNLIKDLIFQRIKPLKALGILPNDAHIGIARDMDSNGQNYEEVKISVNGRNYCFIIPITQTGDTA